MGDAAAGDRDVDTPWARRPTGIPGGSPAGPRTRIGPDVDEATRRALGLENQCADVLAGMGYRVHQNPTGRQVAEARLRTADTGKPRKTPDYLIEGYVFDCYSPTPPKQVRGIWTEVSKKIGDSQTQRVVLNLQDWRGDLASLRKQFDDWPVPGLKELAAVTRSGAIIQIVPRHGGEAR